MKLPDFITRALSFFDKAETQFQTKISELEKANQALSGSVAKLEATIKELNGTIAERDASIKDLNGEVAAHEATIKGLQGNVQTEKSKANIVIANQGIDPNQVPAAETTAGAKGGDGESAWDKYNRLLATDARAAGAFYAANADKILAGRFEKK